MYDSYTQNQLWDLEVGDPVLLVDETRPYDGRNRTFAPLNGIVAKIGRKYAHVVLALEADRPYPRVFMADMADGYPKTDKSGRREHAYTVYTPGTLERKQTRQRAIKQLVAALGIQGTHRLSLRYISTEQIIAAADALMKGN